MLTARRTSALAYLTTAAIALACAAAPTASPGAAPAPPTPTKTPEPATAACAYWDHADAQTRGGGKPQETDPAIKGAPSSDGQKTYYVPGMRRYPAVSVDEGQGGAWFCKESEAERAGWRAAASPRE